MRTNRFPPMLAALILGLFLAALHLPARGQKTSDERDISAANEGAAPAEQIVKNRWKPAAGASAAARPPRSQKYVYRRRSNRVKPAAATVAKPSDKSAFALEEIGVTVWRLRKKYPSENAPSIGIMEDGVRAEYIPERVSSDTPLKLGDKIRITIESPRTGYLYIIDREKYSDDTYSKPVLIFPTKTTRGGNNKVSAGVLIDIPGQDDATPYFVVNSKHTGYAGEVLSVIVSREPLKGFTVPERAYVLENTLGEEQNEDWEVEADIFEQENGAGKSWTDAEMSAGRMDGKALTQEDPTPQTIYRVRANKQKPFLVNIGWSVLK